MRPAVAPDRVQPAGRAAGAADRSTPMQTQH